MFADIIRSPDYIAVVVEDSFDPNENIKSDAIIPPEKQLPILAAGSPVIVGAATWKLEPGSKRQGQYVCYPYQITSALDWM
ncbi:hypothetical protein GGR51DRAFT_573391 [Nemania sp. FL0031]|nr:hypothetical protein GGR51DRAFT_573391 [Nemania sp. FL0031]